MAKRIRLTDDELEALIGIGSDVDADETVVSCYEFHERKIIRDVWDTGMDKLRAMLAARRPA